MGHLKLSGPQKVDLASFGGSVDIFGLQDITLGTKGQGQVSFCFFPIFVPKYMLLIQFICYRSR